jgi:molybdenum cofactor biosynthesis enzyme MoaA
VVDAQIQLVEDMLAGSLEVRTPPLEFCAAATAQCNFRCVMCPYGEDPGHPGDELPASFWKELVPWLGRIRTLDINGGEPLVSKTFRQFVETTDFSQFPQLALHLTTNGSLLTPARLARYRRLPFSSLTISVNAATSATYKTVNRGVPWTTLRRNLDELVRLRGAGDYQCCIRYSMVILKANLAEISAFADMARADGVGMRFLLPVGNRNQQTIMDQPDLVREARESLGHVLQDLLCRGLADDARDLEGTLSVLDQRLRDGDYSVL